MCMCALKRGFNLPTTVQYNSWRITENVMQAHLGMDRFHRVELLVAGGALVGVILLAVIV